MNLSQRFLRLAGAVLFALVFFGIHGCSKSRSSVDIDGVTSAYESTLAIDPAVGDIYIEVNDFSSIQDLIVLDVFFMGPASDVYRFGFDLSYDPALADAQSAFAGVFLQDLDCDSGCVVTEVAINSIAGSIRVDLSRSGPVPGIEIADDPATWVAQITLSGQNTGEFDMVFSNVALYDSTGSLLAVPTLTPYGGTLTIKNL